MPTTVTKTIGPSGDYSTLQSWEDAAPANLVTSDQIWQGVALVGSSFTNSGAAILAVGGSTSSAACYKSLTVQSGGAWCDSASNALTFDTTKGVFVSTAFAGNGVVITESFARVSRLQLRNTNGYGLALAFLNNGGVLKDCILDSQRRITVGTAGGTATVINCTVLNSNAGNSDVGGFAASGASNLVNCGAVCTSTSTATNRPGFGYAYPNGMLFTNCWSVGYSLGFQVGSGSVTFSGCRSSGSETATGITIGLPFTNATFVNVNRGGASNTWNLKAASGSTLLNAGVTDTTASPDPYGTIRPQGAAYDVGPYELPGATADPVLSNLVATSIASTSAIPRVDYVA